MGAIDLKCHPLLYEVARGAQWVGKDDFPSCTEWADEHETRLQFVKALGGLAHYLPRLRGPKERRDEAFAEIALAYFFGVKCGMPILAWEPPGHGGKVGEFLLGYGAGQSIFVEVKSPGWEDEVAKTEGQSSPRLTQPKYIHAEARSTAPWASVRHAVRRAYPKLPLNMPTLLVVNDDLMVALNDWLLNVDIALYCPRGAGDHSTGYLAEDRCIVGNQCEHLGGVGIFNVDLPSQGMRYRFVLFENPHALPAVALPPGILAGYPRYDGSRPVP